MNQTEPAAGIDVGSVVAETYEVVRPLGRGGMGAVFEARHLRLPGKRVAIKVLHAEVAADAEALARFRREAEIASRLGHPNIVEVHDFNNLPSGAPYLVLEYLEGESLDDRMRRGRLSAEEIFSVIRQIGGALRAAHRERVVHRDLKPANVFLARTGDGAEIAKVLDFGISKIRGSTTVKTQEATMLGTPQYMAPEQATGNHAQVDARTDVFALGAMVYEMFTGRPAFGGQTIPEVVFKVVYEDPAPLSEVAPGVEPRVAAAVAKALAKKREERFASVEEFVMGLTGSPLQTFAGGARSPAAPAALASTVASQSGAEAFLATASPSAAGAPSPLATGPGAPSAGGASDVALGATVSSGNLPLGAGSPGPAADAALGATMDSGNLPLGAGSPGVAPFAQGATADSKLPVDAGAPAESTIDAQRTPATGPRSRGRPLAYAVAAAILGAAGAVLVVSQVGGDATDSATTEATAVASAGDGDGEATVGGTAGETDTSAATASGEALEPSASEEPATGDPGADEEPAGDEPSEAEVEAEDGTAAEESHGGEAGDRQAAGDGRKPGREEARPKAGGRNAGERDQALPPDVAKDLKDADAALRAGKLREAERLATRALRRHDAPAAHVLLARVACAQQDLQRYNIHTRQLPPRAQRQVRQACQREHGFPP